MIRLSDASDLPVETIGGKAKRLATLMSFGLPVKPAFVLNVDDVDGILRGPSVALEKIESVIASLRSTRGFAVRSSAVGEDGVLSWAGQFATTLFVHPEKIADSIKACADAVNSETVAAYAAQNKLAIPKLALVIQEMVDAAYSGVIFTSDPMGSKNVMVIEVVEGVGESLVSGQREPRRYHVESMTGRVIKTSGAETPKLANDQLDQLTSLGVQLSDLFSCPQDIEWAFERETNALYVLQSRDITVTADDLEQIREDVIVRTGLDHAKEFIRLQILGCANSLDVLSDQNIAEILTPHPCRMTFGLFTYGFAHGNGGIRTARNEMGYEIGAELDEGFFRLVGGQPRCSIVHDAFTYRVRGFALEDYAVLVQHYLKKIRAHDRLANYPEIGLYDQNPSLEFLSGLFGEEKAGKLRQAYETFYAGFRDIEASLDAECRQEFIPRWREQIRQAREVESPTVEELAQQYQRIADLLRTEGCRMFVKAARLGFFAFARLKNLLAELYGPDGEAYLNVLSSGIPLELNPNLQFGINLAKLRDGKVSIDQVVEQFGHLSAHELEISTPRYRDQRSTLLQLAQLSTGDPEEDFRRSAQKSADLIKQLQSGLSAEDWKRLEYEIRMVRTFLPLREVIKFEFLRAYDVLRDLAVRMNDKLGWDEGLIFHLDPLEVFYLNNGPRPSEGLKLVALSRRALWRKHRQLHVPKVIWTDRKETIGVPETVEPGKALMGVGVTNFITEGEVVVIRSLEEKERMGLLRPGSILVTVTTDPAWTPLLAVIGHQGGLVTEVGGLLAHAAVYARETGLAAVLNVPNVTTLLKTGMRVRVNGPQGRVEILG